MSHYLSDKNESASPIHSTYACIPLFSAMMKKFAYGGLVLNLRSYESPPGMIQRLSKAAAA